MRGWGVGVVWATGSGIARDLRIGFVESKVVVTSDEEGRRKRDEKT